MKCIRLHQKYNWYLKIHLKICLKIPCPLKISKCQQPFIQHLWVWRQDGDAWWVSVNGGARSGHRRSSVRKGVLRNFTKFTIKHFCQSLFLDKISGDRPVTLVKKDSGTGVFLWIFVKFLIIPFLQNTFGWLLLWCRKTAKNSTRNNYGKTVILPEAYYHEELRPSVFKGCKGSISEQESTESDTNNTDRILLEYNTDVDEQEIIQKEIGNEATFLLGASAQFGRSIKFNRKIFWKFLKLGMTHDSLMDFGK